MIHDAVTAGLVLQHPLETRLDAVIATATSTYLDALDDEDRATAKLYVQKAPRQLKKRGSKQSGEEGGQGQTSNTPPPLLRTKTE